MKNHLYSGVAVFVMASWSITGLAAAHLVQAPPDWSGVWALPDSTFTAAMGRVAHGNGPEAPSYVPGYLESHSGFGKRPGADTHAQGDANAASCRPNGVPAVMGVPVGYEFMLTPGLLVILIEEGPTVRHVYLDGRPHTPDPDPSYTGESIGHWEGTTLVVDTTGISPKAQFFFGVNTTGKTHLVERIHLIDHDHLRIDTEISDPLALQKTWHYSWTYVRTHSDFMPNVCDMSSDRDRNGEPDLTPPPDETSTHH